MTWRLLSFTQSSESSVLCPLETGRLTHESQESPKEKIKYEPHTLFCFRQVHAVLASLAHNAKPALGKVRMCALGMASVWTVSMALAHASAGRASMGRPVRPAQRESMVFTATKVSTAPAQTPDLQSSQAQASQQPIYDHSCYALSPASPQAAGIHPPLLVKSMSLSVSQLNIPSI